MKTKKDITTFEEHLTKRHGSRGTEGRTDFEIKANAFMIGEISKEERKLAKMTKGQLVNKKGKA